MKKMNNSAQIDIFGQSADVAPFEPAKRPKKRDINAEAERLLKESGISALPREAKEYVLASMISKWAPELQSVMTLAMIMNAHKQRIEVMP